MKLIDKAALVAEIERKKDKITFLNEFANGTKFGLQIAIDIIDTLEVKEMDFSTEIYKYIDEHFNVYDDGNQTLQTKDKKSLIGRVDVENIAKHFFELGLKAQKGE